HRVSEGAVKKEERPRKFQAIRGTRDLLPPETALWNRVEQTAHEVFATFSFGEIRLPIFEPTELFARAVGGETDIVSKEMYTFTDGPSSIPEKPDPHALGEYLRAAEEEFGKGEIPNTSANRLAIDQLKAKFEEFRQASMKMPLGAFVVESEEAFDKYQKEWNEAAVLASRISRGNVLTLRP